MSLVADARAHFHSDLKEELFVLDGNGKPSNADKKSPASTAIARSVADALGVAAGPGLKAQPAGSAFERITAAFLKRTFLALPTLRPGDWTVEQVKARSTTPIARYEQYAHLGDIERAARETPELRALLGLDYMVASDVVIARRPMSDEVINTAANIVDGDTAQRSALRADRGAKPSLHACVSCKWTMRSDRAQNARSEALSLIRTRRGRVPHIVVLTAEPMPTRLASLALGTGDIDCVYHIALPELEAAVLETAGAKHRDMLALMIDQQRLKDISDLPLDLAV